MDRERIDRKGRMVNRTINLMIGLICITGLGVAIVAVSTHSVGYSILCAAVGILALVLISKKGESMMIGWRADIDTAVDYKGRIGRYIQLDSFSPDETFPLGELEDRFPVRPHYKREGHSLIRDAWNGMGLSTACVDYYNEHRGHGGDTDVATHIVQGQVAVVEARTGIPGRLLLIRNCEGLGLKGPVTKVTHRHLLQQRA